MDTKAVTLMVRYKDSAGKWKRSPAARGGNGRVKPGHVLLDGKIVPVENGSYEIRHTVNRKTAYKPAGTKAAVADAEREKLESTKAIIAKAEDNPDVDVIVKTDRRTLKKTALEYITIKEKIGSTEAAEQARLVTGEFLSRVGRTYVDEVTADDIFAYHARLRKVGLEPRTVANKHARLASWLKFAGIDPKKIPPKPVYEQKLPNMYSREQTEALLAAADPYQRMLVLIALKTGLRDGELMHLEFSDINWSDRTLRVMGKPHWEHHVKTYEQRNVPVPSDVLEALEGWRKVRTLQTLILGTKNRKPNTKLLKALKTLARQARLNCGSCSSCLGRHKECDQFTLHRFRRTYLTTLLRNGIDLRTVQQYAGHRDIASTMRYLSPEAGEEAQAKLNAVKW